MRQQYFKAVAGAGLALAAYSSQAQAATELVFCNSTGSKVFVALATLPDSTKQWTLDAWHTIGAGSCKTVGNVRTGLFYYYAEKEGRKLHWPAAAYVDKNFCVPDTRVHRVMTGATCATGERSLGFRGLTPSAGKYTFTLN